MASIGVLLAVASAFAAGTAAGRWLTEDKEATIEIAPCVSDPDALCGRIVALKEPLTDSGQDKVDINNKDAALRTRPIIGMNVIEGFRSDGDDTWSDGRIYNPEDGETYRSNITLTGPNTLEVEGCVLIFCRVQTWTRSEP